jgi:hypothetical protein
MKLLLSDHENALIKPPKLVALPAKDLSHNSLFRIR